MTPENQSSERANPEASALYQVPQWPRVIPCLDSSGFFNYTLLFLWWLNLGILSLKIPFLNIYLLIYVVLWERGVHAPWYFCGYQRTTCRSPFSPSTMRVLRFEFKSLVLAASPCTCWALLQGPDAIFKWSDEWDAFLSERKKKCVSLGEYYHVTASSRLYLYSMNNLCYS